MTFLNPWALLGAIAIVGPIAAHLLARQPARRLRFPTVRFLPATIPAPVRRSRISDLALLLLRSAIIGAAAIALAQPVWLTSGRARALGTQIARAVIVDSSASMTRPSVDNARAIDVARKRASEIATEATISRVAETDAPSSALRAAASWLVTQPMRREVVIVSDFQRTAIDQADLDEVPADLGIRLIKVAASGNIQAASAPTLEPVLVAESSERESAEAALAAAVSQGAPARLPEDRPVAIVFPASKKGDVRQVQGAAVDAPWMSDLFLNVVADPLVVSATASHNKAPLDVLSATGDPDKPGRLKVFVDAPAHSLVSAAVISAVLRAASVAIPASERVTESTTDEQLRGWERTPAEARTLDGLRNSTESDARWVWAAVALMLLLETWVRSRRPAAARVEERSRVA